MATTMAATTATTATTTTRVLCCMCGVLMMEPNAANTCPTCLASRSDITRGISTEATLHQCRGCSRWHKHGGQWVACELESRELMGLCLAHVSGLKSNSNNNNKVRLVDAGWIWTEPHSMRLKVRLTVQRQVEAGGNSNTILQQSFTVNFIVRNQQCIECQANFQQGTWKSLIQVRQRVAHKRTFLYLEQLILKYQAHRGCLSIETFKDGMDFYFPDKGKAARFLAFLEGVVPLHAVKTSKKLISTDVKSNISNFKHTSLAEICPLCKDDLVLLPPHVARNLGNLSRLVLVKNVSNVVHLVDPLTGQVGSLSPEVYSREQAGLRPLITARRSRLTRYVVLGKEAVFLRPNASQRAPSRKQRSKLARLTVARQVDLGVNDAQYEECSHVGYLCKAGDVCVGFDLKDATLADDEAERLRSQGQFPDVIVVRKLYGAAAAAAATDTDDASLITGAAAAARKHKRQWKLERLQVKNGEEEDDEGGRRQPRRRRKKAAAAAEDAAMQDEEDFLREVEADKDMRLNINLYKQQQQQSEQQQPPAAVAVEDENMDDEEDDEDDQQIKLDELLDSLALEDGADEEDAVTREAEGGVVYEEGERAAKDGLQYVSRLDARSIPDKAGAVVVTEPAKDFDDL